MNFVLDSTEADRYSILESQLSFLICSGIARIRTQCITGYYSPEFSSPFPLGDITIKISSVHPAGQMPGGFNLVNSKRPSDEKFTQFNSAMQLYYGVVSRYSSTDGNLTLSRHSGLDPESIIPYILIQKNPNTKTKISLRRKK